MNLKGFFEYVKKDKRAGMCLILLFFGFLLLIFGAVRENSDTPASSVAEEEKIEQLCQGVEGVGECRVTLSYDGESIAAVVVLCDGGDDVGVQKRISDLLATLYGVGYNRIKVDKLYQAKN